MVNKLEDLVGQKVILKAPINGTKEQIVHQGKIILAPPFERGSTYVLAHGKSSYTKLDNIDKIYRRRGTTYIKLKDFPLGGGNLTITD